MIPIEGTDLPFVLGGLDFLKEVRGELNPRVGPRVVVVGGGNVAIDVALTALRQGGRRVDMVCLEKRREMPAHVSEVETALAEGVAIHNSWGPVGITADHRFTAQRCTRVFDDRGRFSPQFDPEKTLTIDADHVILAIGQATDLACVEVGSLVEVQHGLICADPADLKTREEGVFAGGDVVYGPQTVVEAVRAGRQAAASIHAYLKEKPMDPSWDVAVRRAEVTPLRVNAQERTNLKRPDIPEREVEDRKGTFQHIELGLTDEMSLGEASRCLRCDLCIGCGLCQLVCSEFGIEALRMGETKADRLAYSDFTRAANRCVGCGACANACPTGAIKMIDGKAVRRTLLTGTAIQELELLTCSVCGEPIMTQVYLDYLKSRVGPHAVDHVDRRMCATCAREKRANELGNWP
jgi:formate hydrogenlyase subunit 6/NADH:ubiquinone oxidoreductase subunit I